MASEGWSVGDALLITGSKTHSFLVMVLSLVTKP